MYANTPEEIRLESKGFVEAVFYLVADPVDIAELVAANHEVILLFTPRELITIMIRQLNKHIKIFKEDPNWNQGDGKVLVDLYQASLLALSPEGHEPEIERGF